MNAICAPASAVAHSWTSATRLPRVDSPPRFSAAATVRARLKLAVISPSETLPSSLATATAFATIAATSGPGVNPAPASGTISAALATTSPVSGSTVSVTCARFSPYWPLCTTGRARPSAQPSTGTRCAIFSGHTHQKFAHLVPVEGWADGLARPVVQSGQYGENLAHVTLTVDPDTGDVVANAAEIVPLAGAGFTPGPEVAAIVANAVAVANELGNVSLGEITANFNRARTVAAAENRGGESTLGNLVADVQLWATADAGAQIAFMNPGGLRTDLMYASTGATDPDGNVTYREAANVQPFANTLVTTTLTGQQVIDVLEEQWQPDGATRPFLKLGVAGLTYTYDPTAARGEWITQAWVGDQLLDVAGTYTVVVNSFLASGGDNFSTLAQGVGARDSGRVDLQAFVDYLTKFSPISPDLAQRAVGVHLTTPVPEAGFLPGDTVTADLSSLLFSAGEAQGDQVVLSIGGTEVGSATMVG